MKSAPAAMAASASGTHEDNEENLFSVFTDEEGSL